MNNLETVTPGIESPGKKKILIVAPFFLLFTVYLAYSYSVSAWGLKTGYFIGFLFYWIVWCILFPLWLLGKKDLLAMFLRISEPFGRPAWPRLTLLFTLPLFTLIYALPIQLPRATLLIIVVSFVLAVVNGTLEEVLWRGTYFTVFPKSILWGYFYPAIWFGLWHYAPQAVSTSSYPGGAHSLVLFAIVLGLTWGWVAWKTKSIMWTTIAHIILDFAGLGALFYFG